VETFIRRCIVCFVYTKPSCPAPFSHVYFSFDDDTWNCDLFARPAVLSYRQSQQVIARLLGYNVAARGCDTRSLSLSFASEPSGASRNPRTSHPRGGMAWCVARPLGGATRRRDRRASLLRSPLDGAPVSISPAVCISLRRLIRKTLSCEVLTRRSSIPSL